MSSEIVSLDGETAPVQEEYITELQILLQRKRLELQQQSSSTGKFKIYQFVSKCFYPHLIMGLITLLYKFFQCY